MTDLLPCPFCGGEAKLAEGPIKDRWGVMCSSCECWIDNRSPDKAEAIAAWNRRAEMTKAPAN